jgi:hypothetical protein
MAKEHREAIGPLVAKIFALRPALRDPASATPEERAIAKKCAKYR